MRFIHAADLHIDSPLRGLSRYPGAPLERLRGATRRALERLVDLALAEQVDFVLLAGDLYDRDWLDFHTGLFVRSQMVRLGRADIRVFIVQGNHDAHGVITRQVSWPDNVKLFSSRSAETVHWPELGVAIHGRSFPDRAVPEDWVPDYPAAQPGCFNIGLLHTSLTGAEGHDTYAPTSLALLRTKGYDYWALGHIHQRQVLSQQPRVVFPGNLQGRHAKETGPKGCELVTVQGAHISSESIALDVVRWHQVALDVTAIDTLDDFTASVTAQLQALTPTAANDVLHAVRVLLAGASALHALEAVQPGTLAAAVQAAAQDVRDADMWIERVHLALHSPVDRAQLAQGSDALAELVRGVDALAQDPAALADLCRSALAEVLNKMPAEVSSTLTASASAAALDDLPRLDQPEDLLALLRDAEATLLARLNPASRTEMA
ncbi:MAG: DNA repair exonuclease [Burkholderiaceae bacterium]|nr:DNA repair exonuclease [Burkholderiaceae bacterium]